MLQRWRTFANTPLRDLSPIERFDAALVTLVLFLICGALCWAAFVVFWP